MEDRRSTQQLKRDGLTEALTPTISKRTRPDVLEESPLLFPSSDLSEKVDVPSASGANSDPSASSTSVNGNNYYVFLSFEGPDICKSFVDHLYHRLKEVGLPFHPNFVVGDEKDLHSDEKIAENLINAIKHSKVSIPFISENYAASKWCLRELIQIMECVDRGEQKVLPVLYKVKPYEVRELEGAFGEAFKSCKNEFEDEVKQQGLEALRKAVDSKAFELEEFADGLEGELVNELVELILIKQQHDFQPHLPKKLVAIDDHVAKVMELVDLACLDTRIIGIWGRSGIGKTTLATIIYNKLFDNYRCRSSLKDIRETTKSKGMEHVQSLLISDMISDKTKEKSTVLDPEMGIEMIQSSCENKKVLILLDDVDHRDHLDKLIGHCNFGSGSRIIITCQDKAVLESKYKMYELKEMNQEESMLLFSRYAFEGEQPPIDLVDLSIDIFTTIGGLPLALIVIGSLFKEKDSIEWNETLERLRNAPNETVQEKLRISYDTLTYKEQQMFLDIACFFIGTDKTIATYFWADLKFFPITGLQILINRSLIKIDDKNQLRMHDQLRDLGRAIACPADKKPCGCSRLWDKEEVKKVLRCKEENGNIEALLLDQRDSTEFMWPKSFKKMPKLKFLHVKDVDFDGDFEESLAELRWLKCEGCYSFEPTNVHLEKLVVLDLSSYYSYHSGNNISENWSGWSSIKMEKLKVLNLSGCIGLKNTPNLSVFKNLEELNLEGCICLEKIDPSIRDVKCLVSLNLRYCERFKKLPKQLDKLENLKELVVDNTLVKKIPPWIGSMNQLKRFSAHGCSQLTDKLSTIPPSIGKLGELVELNLSNTSITGLPESIGELNNLKSLRLHLSKIKRLPSSIGKLQSLEELDASECYYLKGQIHVDKGGLFSLKTLRLGWSRKISGLPENLDQLSSLKHLDLRGCGKLWSLPKPPCSLSSLWLTCRTNELTSLSHLNHLQELSLWDCGSLQSIPKLPSCIQKLHICRCPKLGRLPKLSDLEFLSELQIKECDGLKELDGLLESLKSLRRLDLDRSILDNCDGNTDILNVIQDLETSRSLEVGSISGPKDIRVLHLSSG